MARKELVALRGRDGLDEAVQRPGPTLVTYVRPWLTTGLMVPAGWAAHVLWGDMEGWSLMAAAGVTAAGGVVTWIAHRLTAARSWYAHRVSVAATGAGTLWLATASIAGTGRPMLDILILGGGALAASSNIHTWAKGQGSAEDTAAKKPLPFRPWEEITRRVGLHGTRLEVTEATEARLTGTVHLTPGAQQAEDLARRTGDLASAYELAPGSVRVKPDPTNAARAKLTVVAVDVLGEPNPWPGLEHAGASIADAPLHLGTYEDGEPFEDDIYDHHTLTVGMSGSGKSVYGKVKIVSIAARRDTFVLAVDLAKGRQTLGPVSRAIGWAAFEKKAARALLAALKRAVHDRADYLAERKLPNWTSGCGLVFLHVLLEEAAELVDFDELVELMRVARSAGVHIEASLQRATWTNLDTDARSNFGSRICLGVMDEGDADKVLPDHVMEAGAAPHLWGDTRPGCAYAATKRTSRERHTVPLRFFGPPDEDPEHENDVLAEAAAALPDQDAKLDPITRRAFGEPYAAYRAGLAAPAVAAEDQEDADVTEEAEEVEPVEPFVFSEPDDEPELTADLDDPIEVPAGGSDDFALAPRKHTSESAEEARAALEAMFQTWADRGLTSFRAPEVGQGLREAGINRKRAWVYRQLARLRDEGRIRHEDDGSYTILTGELAGV